MRARSMWTEALQCLFLIYWILFFLPFLGKIILTIRIRCNHIFGSKLFEFNMLDTYEYPFFVIFTNTSQSAFSSLTSPFSHLPYRLEAYMMLSVKLRVCVNQFVVAWLHVMFIFLSLKFSFALSHQKSRFHVYINIPWQCRTVRLRMI